MKKILLTTIIALSIFTTNAQVIIDTVSLGAGYANQKWYSLQNDEQGFSPKNNWDLAFDVSGFGTSIHINSVIGTMVWTYPNADTTGWATLDTAGIGTWTPKYNSDTAWTIGALDKGNVTSNAFDVGWGIYNQFTHIITGDSLFVIKLGNGSYKKLWIQNATGTDYNFKYADINGSNPVTQSLTKSTYSGKLFGYFSIQNNTSLNREPVASANWDLTFLQYTGFVPTPYSVTGVLANKDVKVAQADDVTNPTTYNNWTAHSYSSRINEIGFDWKAYTNAWKLVQDTVYFVKSKQGDIWKLQFTGFGGASNGNFIFSKELISAVSVAELNNSLASISVYPNPTSNGTTTLIYNLEKQFSLAELNVIDVTGKVLLTEKLNTNTGFYSHTINTQSLSAGVYFVSVKFDNKVVQQKLVVQ